MYDPLPPATIASADPLLPPLQVTFVSSDAVTGAPPAFIIVATDVLVQEFASITVTV